jgi:Leucine-rich repeat (LRR) protein
VSVDVVTFGTSLALLGPSVSRLGPSIANLSLFDPEVKPCRQPCNRREVMNTSAGCGTTSAAGARVTMSASVAPEERRMTSACMPSTGAGRSEMLQPKRPQPSAETNEQLHSTRPFIPTDLVQNTAEYLGRVAGFLSFRGVSTEWQRAVSDAVGFLNGRCWDRLECHEHEGLSPVDSDELWTRLRLDDAALVDRCAVLFLRPRLAALSCDWSSSDWIPRRLFGETNEALVTLSGAWVPRHDLSCLLGCVALRELSLRSRWVTNASFARLGPLLARLDKLDLSECKELQAISNLAPATSLRELNLARSGVADLGELDKLAALETLDVTNICTEDLSILRQCPRLVTLTAKGDITALEDIIHAAPPSLVDCRLHIDDAVRALDSRSLSCLRRSTILKFSDVDNASLQGLEGMPSLVQLDLSRTRADDVRSLAGCCALKKLMLQGSSVTDVGIIGLERIATLEVLNLAYCWQITSVTSLRRCTALRELILDGTRVTDAGIAGLECIITLTRLSLADCNLIMAALANARTLTTLSLSFCREVHDVSALAQSVSLRLLDLSSTAVCDTGIDGLEHIPSLTSLTLWACLSITNVTNLFRSKSLRWLVLSQSSVTDAGLVGLEMAPTLELVELRYCPYLTFSDVAAVVERAAERSVKVDCRRDE